MEMKLNKMIDESNYWDKFYTTDEINELLPPSQFGAFILGELPHNCLIIDIGCGTGRDTIFFSRQNHPTIGIDSSSEAINRCIATTRSLNLKSVFINANIHDEKLTTIIRRLDIYRESEALFVYARFFLHAITDTDEESFFTFVKEIGKNRATRFAVEFRTQKDSTMPKATKIHYRRFINPIDFVTRAILQGFNVEYYIEGFGFAKYKLDDAHIARIIFSI